MKVKDLPRDTDLRTVKVKIPDNYKHQAMSAGLHILDVYLWSSWFIGIWVKQDLESERVFPITGIDPSSVENWEVCE